MNFSIGSDALIASLMTPTSNWGQIAMAKEKQLQQQTFLTKQAEQEVAEQQQAAAMIANFKQRIRSLPLERPDKMRVSRWFAMQEKPLADRLEKIYKGNLAKFLKVEGQQWIDQTVTALEQSQEYQQGIANKENIELYNEAIRKGQNVIGQIDNDIYRSAHQLLADYYKGKSTSFKFAGSYQDEGDQLVNHFGSQYAPGKSPFERTTVSEAEKMNYLRSTHTPEIAEDLYQRKYKNATLFYKTKPLDDLRDFQNKQYDHQVKQQMDSARFQGIQLSNAIKSKKLQGLNNDVASSTDPGAYLRHMIPQSVPDAEIGYQDDGELASRKVLPHSGYDLRSFGGTKTGAVRFSALPILGKNSHAALGALVGAEKAPVSKEHPTGWMGGQVKEGIVAGNGFNAVDLSGTSHRIVHIDSKIYTNPREVGQSSIDGPMGFLKVTLQFDSDADAKKAGLTEGLYHSATRVAAGHYNKDSRELTIYTPAGQLYKNAALNRYLSVQDVGQKVSNDHSNPFGLGLD